MECVEPSDGGLCQADGDCVKHRAEHQWRKDRDQLRSMLLGGYRLAPDYETMICTMLAHMRGRVHMRCFRRYHGGWSNWREGHPLPPSQKLLMAFWEEGHAQKAHDRSAIDSLEEQKDWLQWAEIAILRDDKAGRILEDINARVTQG